MLHTTHVLMSMHAHKDTNHHVILQAGGYAKQTKTKKSPNLHVNYIELLDGECMQIHNEPAIHV